MVVSSQALSRRKLYDELLVLESFLLELEQYVLYRRDSSFQEVVGHEYFERGLWGCSCRCMVLTLLFYENRMFEDQCEFQAEVERLMEQRVSVFERVFEISDFFSADDVVRVREYFGVLAEGGSFEDSVELIERVFSLCDVFHGYIAKILEYRRV